MLVKFLDGTSREIADLSGANLSGANLSGANLSGADLSGADLRSANLRSANLRSTNLRSTNLSGADLSGANLRSANLRSTNLSGADLKEAKGLESFVIAAEGKLIGYKKLENGNIAKLRIPQAAARVNAYGSRKCRAAYVTVISGTGVSKHDGVTKYAPKRKVVCDKFDPDPRVECSGGIHFFLTEQEAKDCPIRYGD